VRRRRPGQDTDRALRGFGGGSIALLTHRRLIDDFDSCRRFADRETKSARAGRHRIGVEGVGAEVESGTLGGGGALVRGAAGGLTLGGALGPPGCPPLPSAERVVSGPVREP
jgi:hypothetical protein